VKLYNFIKQTISEIAEIPINEIKDDSNFQEAYDMDSLEAIEILHRIEKKYKVKLRDIPLENIQTLQDIYNACKQFINTSVD